MEYHISSEMFYATACLIYIFSGIFCGIIRWLHMCRPYNHNGKYFYPARKQATFFFSAIIIQFPYLLSPMDADVWTYIRVFGILYYPVCFSLLFRRYFRKEQLRYNKWNSFYLVFSFTLIIGMLALILFHKGYLLTNAGDVFLWVMGIVGILLIVSFLQVAGWVKHVIDRYHLDNYSNEEDFPYNFAKKVLYSPLIWIGAMWIIFITGSHWVKFYIDIACAFWMVYFLSTILHPQFMFPTPKQKREQEILEEEFNSSMKEIKHEEDSLDEYSDAEKLDKNDSFECPEEIRKEVLSVMLQKYKDPHLQKSEVLKAISFGNKRDANKFIMNVGYYNMVNMFRLEHARLYRDAHPNATIDEVATSSGFKTRYAFNNAKRNVQKIDSNLVDGINLEC